MREGWSWRIRRRPSRRRCRTSDDDDTKARETVRPTRAVAAGPVDMPAGSLYTDHEARPQLIRDRRESAPVSARRSATVTAAADRHVGGLLLDQ